MPVIITLNDRATDRDLLSLLGYLESREELDGRLELRSLGADDRLGGIADAIVVAVGSGGAVTALVGFLATWLERRGNTVSIRLANDHTGRSVEMSGLRLREADATEMGRILRELGNTLGSGSESESSR